jgi:hypothetical protein
MSTANIDPKFALAITHAIKKGIDAKAARSETDVGVYENMVMDIHVEVDEMRVAPDTDKSPTSSIPLLATCALLLKRFQPNDRDRALTILREVMETAMDLGKDQTKNLLEESGVDELQKTLKEEIISKLPRVPVTGAVTVKPENVRVTIKSMSLSE